MKKVRYDLSQKNDYHHTLPPPGDEEVVGGAGRVPDTGRLPARPAAAPAVAGVEHEVVGVGLELGPAGAALRPDADLVVLVVEVLDALEVERLDDALHAEVVLRAAARGHDGGAVVAVDLGDPEAELVRDVLLQRGDGDVDMLEAGAAVEVDVEVLVRVDATQLVEA